jgi:hypothetical protein
LIFEKQIDEPKISRNIYLPPYPTLPPWGTTIGVVPMVGSTARWGQES